MGGQLLNHRIGGAERTQGRSFGAGPFAVGLGSGSNLPIFFMMTEPTGTLRREPVTTAVTMTGPATEAAESELARRYRAEFPGAVRLAYLITGDRSLAEDIAQDAFIRVSARLVQIREPTAFRAYLRRAVVNATNSHFRHQRVVRAHVDRSQIDEVVVTNPDTETRDELWRALRALPERQRAAVVCRYWLDLSEKETAHALSCRQGTVKSMLSRALDSMRSVIMSEGDLR